MKEIDPPVLETPRLRLRPHEIEDFSSLLSLWSDPVLTKFISSAPANESQVWKRLLTYAGHWKLLDYGYWIVELKSSGESIGEVGFSDSRRELKPSIDGLPELGWVIRSEHQGRGFATEALRAVIAWGDEKFGEETQTVCLIDPENLASLKVAAKCGYREIRRTTFMEAPIILFARRAPLDQNSR